MFDTQSRLNLEESLSYERFLLKDCAGPNKEAETFTLVRNDTLPHEMHIGGVASFASTYIAEFAQRMSPLLFCASYKLLDMVVEWIVQENTNKRPWTFQEKINLVSTTTMIFPDFIGAETGLREALLGLYTRLVEYRNAITHREWGQNRYGDLHFDFPKKSQRFQLTVSFAQVVAFGDLMSRVGSYLVAPSTQSQIGVIHLKFILDRLAHLHGKPLFNVQLPRYFRVIRKTALSNLPFHVDIDAIRAALDEQASGHAYEFSLRIECDTATGRILWEIPAPRVPTADFDLDAHWDAFKVQRQ